MSVESSSPAQSTLPADRELVLKVIPMPADCNANGDIFGGWVMAQMDIAGGILATERTARHPAAELVHLVDNTAGCACACACAFFVCGDVLLLSIVTPVLPLLMLSEPVFTIAFVIVMSIRHILRPKSGSTGSPCGTEHVHGAFTGGVAFNSDIVSTQVELGEPIRHRSMIAISDATIDESVTVSPRPNLQCYPIYQHNV